LNYTDDVKTGMPAFERQNTFSEEVVVLGAEYMSSLIVKP
jgi:hypothetical protein